MPGRRFITPGGLNPDVVKIAGPGAEGVISANVWAASLSNEMNKRFVAAFQAKFHEEPLYNSFLAFEGVWLIAEAIKKAGTATDTAKVAETLQKNTWQTPRGTVRFDKNQAIGASGGGFGFINLLVKTAASW